MTLQQLSHKINTYERLMRLDKPIGILLLLWPTLWALLIAGNGKPDWIIVLIFVTGVILMRSAGCVINDIADNQYDRHVERTQHRPIANHEVSKKEASILVVVLLLLALSLVSLLNLYTIKISVIALFLALTYPLTKRFFALPQAYLGLAFGVSIPMAFAAINDYIPPIAWVLLAANVCWAIAYDTEYAMVDREDDLKIGIRSSAITFGRFDVTAIMLCYTLTLSLLTYVGYTLKMHWAYYLGLLAACSIACYHYTLIKNRDKTGCFNAFLGNHWFGLTVGLSLCAHYVVR
ncbi:MAG: 4-hydroxybenzoate octaprenyltransferase [Methylotenera sp.]|nr:4-hydroxybenzoate octaprenyltransferase [Methylotenera sp.]